MPFPALPGKQDRAIQLTRRLGVYPPGWYPAADCAASRALALLFAPHGYNNPVKYTDPTGHIVCDEMKKDNECINYEQEDKELQNKLRHFNQPQMTKQEDMVTVGFLGMTAQVSPGEYELLLNEKGNIDYALLYRMRQIQQRALNVTADLFPNLPNQHNDPADAFRHAYWNMLLTQEFGSDFARSFTNAHETGFSYIPNREEAFMDLYNNGVGRDIALLNPRANDDETQDLIMEALYQGDLYVWDGSDMYYSDRCPICIFP